MNDLSPEARALLELASGEDSPTRDDRVRIRRALAASITAGALASSAPAAASTKAALGAAAGASGTLAKSTVGIWLALGVVAGLAGSAAVFVGAPKAPSASSAQDHGTVRTKTPALSQPITPPAAPESPEPPEATPGAAATRLEPAPPVAPQIARPTNTPSLPQPAHAAAASGVSDAVHGAAPPPAAPSPAAPLPAASPAVTSLGPETALLESARAALGRGDAPGALALLERHEREFPTGTLVEERLAAKVLALCSLGRRDEAARAASRLLRMSPNSPLRARILDSCAYDH